MEATYWILLILTAQFAATDAFRASFLFASPQWRVLALQDLRYPELHRTPHLAPRRLFASQLDTPQDPAGISTRRYTFELSKEAPPKRRWWKRRQEKELQRLSFRYDSNILELSSDTKSTGTTGVIMIHPIGVGIGKWFYNRLIESLQEEHASGGITKQDLLVIATDLLGSGTACNPTSTQDAAELDKLPLLTVQDWSEQVAQLMASVEQDYPNIGNWCVVANGGCSPIALEVAKQSVESQKQTDGATSSNSMLPSFQRPVTNVILSSVPRLPFFLPPDDNEANRLAKQKKLKKSYRTLCGVVGRVFWRYALRKDGAFVQKFSERNLVADAANLGPDWTPNCVTTARMHNGKSRYSTFAFLAGSLQVDGCRSSIEALRDSSVLVDVIKGKDVRRNKAKSWFWQRRKKPDNDKPKEARETLQEVLERNGNRGKMLQVGGRISLAHEDAPGYAKAILEFLSLSD